MRQLFLIFVSFGLIIANASFINKTTVVNIPYKLTIGKGNYTTENGVDLLIVPVILTNTTDTKLRYLRWLCTKEMFYYINNPKLSFQLPQCFKNYCYVAELPAHKGDTIQLKLVRTEYGKALSGRLKIGMNLLIVDDQNLMFNKFEHREKIPLNMIWSNEIVWKLR